MATKRKASEGASSLVPRKRQMKTALDDSGKDLEGYQQYAIGENVTNGG